MEYKRFTKRRKDGSVVLNMYSNCEEEFSTLELIVLRLAELEDKIEAGTLVTVPYAIGQEFYLIIKGIPRVYKAKVSLITIRHDGGVDIRLNHYYKDGSYCGCSKYDLKYDELFNTEEEAQKKLEEIESERNLNVNSTERS